MLNPIPKIVILSVLVGTGAVASVPRAGTIYNPPPRIDVAPLPFRVGSSVKVTGSVFNKPTGGAHPPMLELRVVAADQNGNPPTMGGLKYDVALGSPNWAHWSSAAFPQFAAPNVGGGQTLAMVVTYKSWSAVLRRYLVHTATGYRATASFRKQCGRPPAVLCVYVRQ